MDAPRIVKNIGIAVERARSQGVPVIWVQQSGEDELMYGSPDWQIASELTPAEGETRIHKQFASAFEQTPLDETLAQLGATHIVLAGAATNWCVRAAAYGALDRGYDLTLIKDAHTTNTIELGDDVKIEAQDIVRELNVVMTWIDYPGRTCGTASAEELDFAVPGGVR